MCSNGYGEDEDSKCFIISRDNARSVLSTPAAMQLNFVDLWCKVPLLPGCLSRQWELKYGHFHHETSGYHHLYHEGQNGKLVRDIWVG